ncbi:hypothetical protein LCGC14_0393250 [marine sediment metagenome]|uniref:Uncharacterized protein n=1 Tax=marine sediment metagenome TaxID=412755 RepID=A0A0F9T4X8_9ZZZZ
MDKRVEQLVEKVAIQLYTQQTGWQDGWQHASAGIQVRYKLNAKQILFENNLWLQIGEGEEEWVCDSEGVKHQVRISITISLDKEAE